MRMTEPLLDFKTLVIIIVIVAIVVSIVFFAQGGLESWRVTSPR